MKIIYRLVLIIGFILAIKSCFDPPEYPITPQIEFNNLIFKETGDPSKADSLILFIDFKDGDGDLGLRPDELGCQILDGDTVCYNNKFYFTKNDGTFVTYEDKRENPELQLPDFVTPFNCTNWEVMTDTNRQAIDTLYFEFNQNHHNIFVDFYVKQPDGSFKLFDFRSEFVYPNCGTTFNGRFPILSKDLSQPGPLEGTLRYTMISTAFKLQFSIKTLKLKVQIQDRHTNFSNEIETPEFQFK